MYLLRLMSIPFFCVLCSFTAFTWAETRSIPNPPVVDTSTLPDLAPGWAELNPYRGNTEAAVIGKNAFNQACARCHGADADGSRAPAPDLRRIGMACRRVPEETLKQRCLSDADNFFVNSVLKGKYKFGIEHMPAWESVLTPQLVWSLRSFLETTARQSVGR